MLDGADEVRPTDLEPMTWELSLAIRFTRPAVVSTAVAGVALGSFVAVRWLSSSPIFAEGPGAAVSLEPSAITGLSISLLLGYMIFGNGFMYLERRKELEKIGAFEDPDLESATVDLRRSRVFGTIGALLGLAMVMLVPDSYAFRFDLADADYFWFLVASPLSVWMLARAVFYSLRTDETLERLRAAEIDLLRLEPVQMFGRLGVQAAFLWVVGTSLGALLFFGYGGAVLAPLIGVTLSVGVAALVMPVRGLGERIRAAKRAELAKVTARLEQARDAALEGDPGNRGLLADLLAYRTYVEGIRESPIDAPTLLRFGAYLLIPLGSWSASAIVERIVDAMLD